MNKYYCIFLLFLIISGCCSPTKNIFGYFSWAYTKELPDSVVYVNKLLIIDSSIYPFLDEIIDVNSLCIHHSMGEDTWIELFSRDEGNDTIFMSFEARQYSCILNRSDTNYVVNPRYYGVFYYRDYLFAVSEWANELDYFFEKIDYLERIRIIRPDITVYYEQIGPYSFVQDAFTEYHYVDGQYILLIKHWRCEKYPPIYHQIQKKESLKSLSEEYDVPEEQIIRLNNLKEPILPKKGEIRIQ